MQDLRQPLTLARKALRRPREAGLILRVLPTLLWTKKMIREEQDMHRLLARFDGPAAGQPSGGEEPRQLLRAVRGALYLVGPRQDACIPRSLALFKLLTDRGYSTEFFSGVRRDNTGLDGHAWIMVNDQPVKSSGDGDAGDRYTVNFSYKNARSREQT